MDIVPATTQTRRVKVASPVALSIAATADSIGIGRSTLYQLIKDGRGPLVKKIGRRSVVMISDRDAWLASLNTNAAA